MNKVLCHNFVYGPSEELDRNSTDFMLSFYGSTSNEKQLAKNTSLRSSLQTSIKKGEVSMKLGRIDADLLFSAAMTIFRALRQSTGRLASCKNRPKRLGGGDASPSSMDL